MDYFFFRKVFFVLQWTVVVGILFLLIWAFLPSTDNPPPRTEVPIQAPAAKQTQPPSAVESEEKVGSVPPAVGPEPTPVRESTPATPPPAWKKEAASPPFPIQETGGDKNLESPRPLPTPQKPDKRGRVIPAPAASTKNQSASVTEQEKTPRPTSAPAPQNTVAVQTGESIYALAAKTYRVSNTSIVDRILEANPGIVDPDLLPAKQRIKLPPITDHSLVIRSSDGTFRVRLGAFSKPEYADYLKHQPCLLGKEIEISPHTTPSGKTWFRVSAGKFETQEEALKVIRELKETGQSPYFEGFKRKN